MPPDDQVRDSRTAGAFREKAMRARSRTTLPQRPGRHWPARSRKQAAEVFAVSRCDRDFVVIDISVLASHIVGRPLCHPP